MIVSDVMTRNVLSVSPNSTIEEAAKLMLERGISGLFVVDAKGDLAGVLTEGDMLRRGELGTEKQRSWWLRMLVSPGRQAADFTRANARHVRDVMTRDVVCVASDAGLDEVVAAMETHHIKRVPITEGGRIVGVVSRSDLLRTLVGRTRTVPPLATDDRSLRTAILDTLEKSSWAPMTTLNVAVADGVADIWGTITNDDERRAIIVAAENTPGVKAVHDHLVYVEPYSGTVIEAPHDKS